MPLLSLWQANPDAVRQLTIAQVVATAGDGRLRDGSGCQQELREYLRQASVNALADYADHCLSGPFEKSGHVLQDIVNELGRRLEYQVTNGRYQGTSGAIGFDGLWADPTGGWLVVEVKTTDTYRLSLDTVAAYRAALQGGGDITQQSSVLIVVGRTDTGELEAQIRGSRHAWDIRLISVHGLFQLVRTKESADSTRTVAKIRRLLTPLEYTRLDDLVEVVFSATKDVEQAVAAESPETPVAATATEGASSSWDFTPRNVIQAAREAIIAAMGKAHATSFVQRSRAQFWDPEARKRLVCTISKRYEQGAVRYWYAYHPAWHDFLSGGDQGWFVIGCADLDIAFAIPVDVMGAHLPDFHTTTKSDASGEYFHIKVVEYEPGQYRLQLPRATMDLDLKPFSIGIAST